MIYILHFNSPYRHARHYAGYANDPETLRKRLWLHSNGKSHARLMEVIHDAGIRYTLAVVIEGDRTLERRIKNRGVSRVCPLCNPGFDLTHFIHHERKEHLDDS